MNSDIAVKRLLTWPQIPPHWRLLGLILGGTLLAIVIVWLPAYRLLLGTWDSNGTYTHGYLIAPISLYLIWQARAQWLPLTPRPWWTMLLAVLAISITGGLAMLTDLVGVQHATAVSILIAVAMFFLGPQLSRLLLFPLAYLLFAIPFGEFLLPPLMEFTADFTVLALQLIGIPVYREGLFFSLPSGNWSVVEACSGLRYLIASLALGVLYAWLNYRSRKRRLIFIAICAIVPILANGMRALIIVMLGHVSNMRLATGVDHYIYGWVFFALVMFLLFWLGARWREDKPVDSAMRIDADNTTRPATATLLLAAGSCLLLASLGPLTAGQLKHRLQQQPRNIEFQALQQQLPAPETFTQFEPHYSWARSQLNTQMRFNGKPVGLFVGHYSGQESDKKLISITNKLVTTRQREYNLLDQQKLPAAANPLPFSPIESTILHTPEHIVTWHWFHVCGQTTGSETVAKLLQLRCTLTRLDDSAAVIVFYTLQEADDRDTARQNLQQAVQPLWPAIQATLESP